MYKRPKLPDSDIVAAIGEGLKSLVFSLFPETKNNPTALLKLENDFMDAYSRNLVVRTRPFPGVKEFLDRCPYRIAIVTNKNKVWADKTLAALELHSYNWVEVFGADSLAEKKPHPLPLQEVMRLASAQPQETVMIGDGAPDMNAARNAGVRAIAVEFGYLPKETLLGLGAVASFADYSALPALLAHLDAQHQNSPN